MMHIFARLRSPVVISSILVLPFIALEWINRRSFHEEFPFSLFAWLWLLPVVFFRILTPILQNAQTGTRMLVNPISFLVRAGILILIAWGWIALLLDQMPCFLGVLNCD